jgi:hypothetical protein
MNFFFRILLQNSSSDYSEKLFTVLIGCMKLSEDLLININIIIYRYYIMNIEKINLKINFRFLTTQ